MEPVIDNHGIIKNGFFFSRHSMSCLQFQVRCAATALDIIIC